MAVAPTKNIDRYEWFLEKATEIGVDEITPIIGVHSERKVFKEERANRILISATKQSLKSKIPTLNAPISVSDFILSQREFSGIKLLAYCGDRDKTSIIEALKKHDKNVPIEKTLILIGPEGDFSTEEVDIALKNGFQLIHLGNSRLRTETAAIFAVSALYI